VCVAYKVQNLRENFKNGLLDFNNNSSFQVPSPTTVVPSSASPGNTFAQATSLCSSNFPLLQELFLERKDRIKKHTPWIQTRLLFSA